jgi:sugar phosphate permease
MVRSKYKLVAALWYYGVANYLDRIALSFAAPVIMANLLISPSEFGLILSSFAVGYVLAMIPGGVIADKWGVKSVLVIAPILWGIFSGLTGLVTTVVAFILVRLGLGLSEGLSQGAGFKVQAEHFSARERPFLQGITLTPIAIAPAIAGPFVSLLLASFSWHWVFYALVIPSLLAAFLNYFWVPGGAPEEQNDQPVAVVPDEPFEMIALFRQPFFWLLSMTWCTFNVAYWGYQGWMPSYLAIDRGVDIKTLGAIGGLPYVFGFLGLLFFGWLAAGKASRQRPLLLISAYIGAAIALYSAYSAMTLTGSVAGLSFSAFFLFGGLGVFYTTSTDYSPAGGRAFFWGAVSTAGQMGGVVAPWMIGALVEATGKFASGFQLMIAALGCAILCVALLELGRRFPHPKLSAAQDAQSV